MQFVLKTRHFLSILIIIAICIALFAALTVPANAVEILPQELYMEQSRAGICTLTTAAMLIRSTLYVHGNSHWSTISEEDAANACWLWGQGILFNWSFETDYASFNVSRTVLNGISVEELKAVLDEHPEGIEFYCGGVPHALLLTDYEGDTFYCVDPAPYCSGKRVPLAESWNGYRLGGDQANVLANATAYWSVSDCTVTADMDEYYLKDGMIAAEIETVTDAKRILRNENAWISPALSILSE